MSLFNNTQGGGTGGASASIFVTGLSEADTVTATKDGKTVKGKWGSKTTYEIQPLIPVMTSNTTPSGVASQMNSLNDTTPAYLAFRGKVPTKAGEAATSSYNPPLPWYLGYEFTEEQELTHFEVYFAYPDGNYSKSSTGYISVSNDGGATWKQVISFSELAQGTTHTITLDSPVKCTMFRIYLTAVNNTWDGGSCRIGMVQAYGLVPVVVDGHIVEPIKSYGLWTVTATNGEEAKTRDVLVDVAMDYEIEMSLANYLMLYDYGDECEDVTGGWSNTYTIENWGTNTNTLSEVAPTKNADSVLLKTSNAYTCCPINTAKKVDVSEYTSGGIAIVNNGDVYGSCQMVVCTKLTDNTVNTTQSTDKLKVTLSNVSATSSGKHLVVGELTDTTEACYCVFTTIKGISSDANSSINMFAYFLLMTDDWQALCSKAGISAPSDLATLIADTTSINAILASETAVKYMVNNCTGDFMASFVASSACISALNASPYKSIVLANKHWKKFLAMVGVTA